jgi:hypothetical protein
MNPEVQRHFEQYEAILEIDRPAVAHLLEAAIDFVDACKKLTN